MRNPYCVMVCELPDALDFSANYDLLSSKISTDAPDLVVLPELPFSNWFCIGQKPDRETWEEAIRAHHEFGARLAQLPSTFIYSVPADRPEGRRNIACIAGGSIDAESHSKRHLPNEEGYWEASWYGPGIEEPGPIRCGQAKVGVLLCTEIWHFETSRRLGAKNADIVAVPRTTPLSSRERWICGGRAAAISAGAFCLSSNRSGPSAGSQFGGAGWVIDPDGEVLAVTSNSCPIVTCEIDLDAARRAKSSYPRYALLKI